MKNTCMVSIPITERVAAVFCLHLSRLGRRNALNVRLLGVISALVGPSGTVTRSDASGVSHDATAPVISDDNGATRYNLEPFARSDGAAWARVAPIVPSPQLCRHWAGGALALEALPKEV